MFQKNRGFEIIYEAMKQYYYREGWVEVSFNIDIGELAARLSDDDIGAMLVCIDAHNNLQHLDLSNCHRLVGYGLTPLRGSVALKGITLGEDGHSSLSQESFLPIVDSILDTDGHSLRILRLPNEWKQGESRNVSPLKDVLRRFNELLAGIDDIYISVCKSCLGQSFYTGDSDDDEYEIGSDQDPYNCVTCFTCFRNVCGRCNIGRYQIGTCDGCSITLCMDCGDNSECNTDFGGCGAYYCSLCAKEEGLGAAYSCGQRNCPPIAKVAK